eukprot:TRINITY_DN14221_c0_g2_i1.p1 TRINITY_DN14221_c0_g2~~TRINITY_DN14221_c0_g2_i1.p1  ORF type:complete len:495 (-),score=79.25 TRINITY_DN14221_c0_g2_i1:29-1444(-)
MVLMCAAEECESPPHARRLLQVGVTSVPKMQLRDLNFGGLGHADLPKQRRHAALRPEYVKMERFSELRNEWETCDSGNFSNCFHSTGPPRTEDASDNSSLHHHLRRGMQCCGPVDNERIEGNIAAGSSVSKIAMEIHLHCPIGHRSKFTIQVDPTFTNGEAELFFDLRHQFTFEKWSRNLTGSLAGRSQRKVSVANRVHLRVEPGKVNTFRLEFTRTDATKDAFVTAYAWAVKVPVAFLECMETKHQHAHCISQLNSSSAEAMQLRSNHMQQLRCLDNTSSSEPCMLWRDCLSDHTREHLLTVLQATAAVPRPGGNQPATAAEGSGESREEQEGSGSNREEEGADVDHATCISPDSADPEAWDCDCVDSFHDACDAMGMERGHDCYKLLICRSEKVCQQWKQRAGCGSLSLPRGSSEAENAPAANSGSAAGSSEGSPLGLLDSQAALAQRARTRSSGTTLDGTISGKACTR